ncbi:MAG: GDP-mannose-dependent alpha-mannosyltransferase [Pseudomonadota bacterium]|jgi:glycosyltransferase involved in cell wall biosynthesis
MRLLLVTDAWAPQVNGVVTTLVELVRELKKLGHQVTVVHPGLFKTRPCPGYAGIDLAIKPKKQLSTLLASEQFDAIHIATEGPLGWAARGLCIQRGWAFTTAFHTRFPEVLKAAAGVPLWLGYAIFRYFHKASSGVMVPTQGVLNLLTQRQFKNLKLWTHGVDTDLFKFAAESQSYPALAHLPRPISIFVGRVSYEKNIETYLQMPFEGSKVVCGVGPLEADLKSKYPGVMWLGLLPREELAKVYASADVFVFPSRNETFGLVMLEAMACGTPVAAYPVDGPIEVLTTGLGLMQGGVLHTDLKEATDQALQVPRNNARARAHDFSWQNASELFLSYLRQIKPS